MPCRSDHMEPTAKEAVDTNISDLFFNTELDDVTRQYDAKGQFVGYNDEKMLEAAQDFLASLYRLGVPVPAPRALVDDFYGRL